MITDQLATLLRSTMILSGGLGFTLGVGISLWNHVSLSTALFRGALICVICTVVIRMFLMSVFRAYVQQLQLRKQNDALEHETKKETENKK